MNRLFFFSNRCGAYRRIKSLIVKEFYQIIKDPSSLLISVVLPILLLFLYGYGISFDLKHIKIGVVLEDSSPQAQSFLSSLSNTHYFDVKVGRDRREFENQLTNGSLKGIVVIPSYFSSFKERKGQIAPIQVIADGSEPNTATFVQNYVRAAYENWMEQESVSSGKKLMSGIRIASRFWYNESVESRNFLIPGSLAIILTLIGTLLTSLVIAREWERGTMESLISTPVKMIEVIIAKLFSYFILGMFAFLMSVILAILVYDIPLQSSIFMLCLVAAVFLSTALGLGLLISTVTKNQFAASQGAIVAAFLPSFFLSGFIYEVTSMPKIIQTVTYFISAKYFVSSLQTLFLAGMVWRLILYNLLMMFLIGFVFFFITARQTVKRLD